MKHLKNPTTLLKSTTLALALILGVFPSTAYAAVPLLLAPLAAWALKGAVIAGLVGLFMKEIVAFLGSIFLNLAAYILGLSGNVFNWLIERTVIDFAETLKTLGMMNGIDTVWTAFRDISNIVIIGMFTFIAISIILGVKEYGQKKLIANVLIIAVLLNFSLLFSKMIIDASNFTALQFYNSASLPQSSTSGGVAPLESSAADGISGRFLNIMGITGFWDTFSQLSDSAKLNGSWSTFGYALTGTILLLMVAGVFLYGSFLLAARAALLVFIMIISPLAFASHLIPWIGDVSYGWKGWWKNLVRCALFGPLLMIFLWASLLILGRTTPKNTSFGDFLTNPANPDAWQLVVIYCFTVAFLFLSIRFANSFAGHIGGFSIAQMVTAGPLAFAGNFAWNRGRNLVQRGAGVLREGTEKDLGQARRLASQMRAENRRVPGSYSSDRIAQVQAMANKLEKKSSSLEKFRTSKVSPFETWAGKATMKGLGVPGILTGKAESFGAQADKTAKEAAARGEKAMLLTDKDKEKMQGESLREAQKRHSDEKRVAKDQLEYTKALVDNAQHDLGTIRNQDDYKEHEGNKRVAESRVASMEKTQAAEIKRMISARSTDDEIKTQMGRHEADMRSEKDKIEEARREITRLEATKIAEIAEHNDALSEQQRKADYYSDANKVNAIKTMSDEIQKGWTEASAEVAATTAEQIAHRRLTNIVPRALREDPKNDYTARLARSQVENNVRTKNQGGDIIKAIKAMTDAAGGSPPPSPTPPATP